MSSPLVSVVVPTFNRRYCLGRTLDSVLGQTHRELELIVVDDGSTDGTREFLRERYVDEPRLRYFYQPNQGVCSARNRGLDAATGEFVALLDSDDIWKPWKLELQLACMARAPHVGMVWSDMEAIRPDGTVSHQNYLRTMYSAYQWFGTRDLFVESWPLHEICPGLAVHTAGRRFYSGEIFSQMVMGNLVHTSTVLLRRERLEKVRHFNTELRRSGEDYDFHIRTCREGPVGFVECSTIRYRRGAEDQLTAPEYTIDRATNFLRTIEPIIKNERARIRLPEWMIQEVLADAHAWIGESQLALHLRGPARRHLVQSLCHKPQQARLIGLLALSLLPARTGDGARAVFRRAKELMGKPRQPDPVQVQSGKR
jgi:glycosyltransferase involved in cell wall biosynthesis